MRYHHHRSGALRRVRLASAAALLASTALASPAGAQSAAGTVQSYQIAPGSLTAALDAFSDASGLTIVYDSALAAGLESPGVAGELTTDAALSLLLQGTNLTFRFTESGAVALDAVAAAGDDGAILMDQIVVQGELQARTLQETQTSVSVATGDALERRGDRSVYDFIERAPNVSQTAGRQGFTIRGISQSGFSGASEPLISVQVDGVALPQSAVNSIIFPTWDLEQVEVLRGPQSTQQGRNALAGAIILRSRDPIYENEYRVRAGVAMRDYFEGAFSFNQVLVEDKVAVRFSGELSRDDGFVDNPTLGIDDAVPSDLESGRAKLRLNPTDDLEAIFSFSYQRSERGVSQVVDDLFPDQRVKFANLRDFNETTQNTAGLRLTYDLTDRLSLESETTYYWQDGSAALDLDQTAAMIGESFFDGRTDVFEQDLRFLFDGDFYTGVGGFFFSRGTVEGDNIGFSRGPIVPLPLPPGVSAVGTTSTDNTTRNMAVFGEIEIEAARFLPGLSFIVGGRYERERQDFSGTTNFFLEPGPTPDFPFFGEQSNSREANFDAFVPKAGVIYEWLPGLSTSFTFQQGYRSGGSSRSGATGLVSDFDPEFTNNYEIAFRGEFLDGALVTNANAFYTRWNDQQVRRFGEFGIVDVTIENAGESRLWGAEFSATYFPTDRLELFGSFGYANTEYLDYVTGADDFTGNEFPAAPKFTGAFGAAYSFDNGISIGVDASYTGSSFNDPDNTDRTKADSRFLVNAQISYETGGFLGGLYVRNLLDNDYSESRFGTDPLLSRTGEPLTVGAFAQFTF
ncbi:MAG: TonB-dependent receptor [Pseudomonadota bacterium]